MPFRFVLEPARTLATLRILGRGPGEFERGICTELINSYNRGWQIKTPTLIQVAERMVIESQQHKNPTPTLSPRGEDCFYQIYANLIEDDIIAALYAMNPAPHVPLATTYVGIAEVEARAAAAAAAPPAAPHVVAPLQAVPPHAYEPEILNTAVTYRGMARTYNAIARAHGGGMVTDIIPADAIEEYYLTRGQKLFLVRAFEEINQAYMPGMVDLTTLEPARLQAQLIGNLYEECDRICTNQASLFDPTANPMQLRNTLFCIVHIREICMAAGVRGMCNNEFARALLAFVGRIQDAI